jgi:hypothetical protein
MPTVFLNNAGPGFVALFHLRHIVNITNGFQYTFLSLAPFLPVLLVISPNGIQNSFCDVSTPLRVVPSAMAPLQAQETLQSVADQLNILEVNTHARDEAFPVHAWGLAGSAAQSLLISTHVAAVQAAKRGAEANNSSSRSSLLTKLWSLILTTSSKARAQLLLLAPSAPGTA